MDRERIVDDVDILGSALFQLLEYLDLMDEVFEILVFFAGVNSVIGGIDVDDFECYDLLGLSMAAGRA